MHFPPATWSGGAYPPFPLSTAVHHVGGINPGPPLLKQDDRADLQVGTAIASRDVSASVAARQIMPGNACNEPLPSSPQQQQLEMITQLLLDYVAGEPSVATQRALYTFFYLLQEDNRSALQLCAHDPFTHLAQQQDAEGHSLLYLAIFKGMYTLASWLVSDASFSVTAPFTGENDPKSNPLFLALETGADVTMLLSLCLLYTSPSPRDRQKSRMPSSA